MVEVATKTLAVEADAVAPDGCEVRLLAQSPRGSAAHHPRTGAGRARGGAPHGREVWYFLAGQGRMWRRHGDERSSGRTGSVARDPSRHPISAPERRREPAGAVMTMPPWPGGNEAHFVGKWRAVGG